jgi:prevent-host-death family protein
MTEWATLGVQKAREDFRTVLDDAQIRGKATVINRHGLPAAAVIPYAWFQELLATRGETDHDDSTSSR